MKRRLCGFMDSTNLVAGSTALNAPAGVGAHWVRGRSRGAGRQVLPAQSDSALGTCANAGSRRRCGRAGNDVCACQSGLRSRPLSEGNFRIRPSERVPRHFFFDSHVGRLMIVRIRVRRTRIWAGFRGLRRYGSEFRWGLAVVEEGNEPIGKEGGRPIWQPGRRRRPREGRARVAI